MSPPFHVVLVTATVLDLDACQRLEADVASAISLGGVAIVLDLGAVALVTPEVVPILLAAVGRASAHGKLVIVSGLPQLRALLLSSPEFGQAQLVATRAAADKLLNSNENLP